VQGLGICLEGDRDLGGENCVGILHTTHTEDTDEIWKTVKEEAMEKVKGRTNRRVRTDSPMVDEAEVEESFCLNRPDGWVINCHHKQENEEDYSSGVQKDLLLWGVLLQGHVEGGGEAAHPYHDGS
jgi:hypothetical protein